tara:strand:+ start:299 stop:1018 length:720 start_codon:yes stop_codon:yes gene_type:complete
LNITKIFFYIILSTCIFTEESDWLSRLDDWYSEVTSNISNKKTPLSSENPWIYTNHPEPKKETATLISLGSGYGGRDSETMLSFKYAFLNKSSKNSYSGYFFSGYSQSYREYLFDWPFYGYASQKYTNILIGYTKLQAITNKNDFKGPYYGYDIGLAVELYDEYLLGLNPSIIGDFLDSKKRNEIGLGVRLEVGYSMGDVLLSSKMGIDLIGDSDFIFIDGMDDLDDHIEFSINVSYKF